MTDSGGKEIDWKTMYETEKVPWHRQSPHIKLTESLELLTASIPVETPTIFLPLCGKSVDLAWLYHKGFKVVGCEFVEKACLDFFRESDIEFKRLDNSNVFESTDSRLRLVCGDFFEMTSEQLGSKVDIVWDRGSLVAIQPLKRKTYAKKMKSLLSDTFRYLLATVDYDASEKRSFGPNSITPEEVIELFQPFCSIRILENRLGPTEENLSMKSLKESLFLLSELDGDRINDKKQDRVHYWQDRWAKGTSKWHSDQPQALLKKYMHLFVQDKNVPLKIFLPLCGKAGCLKWLYDQGHHVVGLEGVPFVAEEFFKDHQLDFVKTSIQGVDGFVLKTKDGRLSIYVCDFFAMKAEVLKQEGIEVVFDRGSFEAINPDERNRYVEKMLSFLDSSNFRIILNGYEYDDSKFKGPPCYVDRKEVFKLFGTAGTVEILEEVDFPEKAKGFGLENMTKILYFIRNK